VSAGESFNPVTRVSH